MTILEKINAAQNRQNLFSNVGIDDLKDICLSIDAMCYFGYKREKAEQIVITEYINGNANFRNTNLVYNYLMHI